MLKKTFHLIIFNLKYEIKRLLPIGIIALLFFLLLQSSFKDIIKGPFKSINIEDKDNSELSREFIEFLQIDRNYTLSEQGANSILIPSGFEEQYYLANGTLYGTVFGVDSGDTYEFQLYKLNETKRINFKTDTFNMQSDLIVIIILVIVIQLFVSDFTGSRLNGKIYFLSNHINFWLYFVCSNIIVIVISILSLIKGIVTFKHILLMSIIFFSCILLVFRLRKNPKLESSMNYILYGLGFVLLWMKFKNFYYLPIIDLLFEGIHPVIIVDIILFIVLLVFVCKTRLTEK